MPEGTLPRVGRDELVQDLSSLAPAEIGLLTPSKPDDQRTLVTEPMLRALVAAGFMPVLEPGAGSIAGLRDDDLRAHGAEIRDRNAVLTRPLLLSYRPPTCEDLQAVANRTVIGSVLHLEGRADLVKIIQERALSAYAFEFLRNRDGRYPLMVAGGRIAGRQAIIRAREARARLAARGLGSERVLIIGSGNVAYGAVTEALAEGIPTTVLARSKASAARAGQSLPGAEIDVNSPSTLRRWLRVCSIVVGAILISDHSTPPMIERQDLSSMPHGAVLVDVTCGYGPGYLPTAGPVQRRGEGPRIVDGVAHIKIDDLPADVPDEASAAYAMAAAAPLADLGRIVLHGRPGSVPWATALVARNGEIVHPEVLRVLSLASPI